MGEGRARVKASPYRDGQNVIRDSVSGRIVYMPPQARDVPVLMRDLVVWIRHADAVPVPIVAGIAHYQFATIHAYYDGNGRVARLLTVLVLHLGGYDLKGLYALEEYYARDLGGYYRALALGPSHNYYLGRVEADITPWLAYFIQGMAASFERVKQRAMAAARSGASDAGLVLRRLQGTQRRVLELFAAQAHISAPDVAAFFGIKPRTAAAWCARWVREGFLIIVNPSRKARRYALAAQYEALVQGGRAPLLPNLPGESGRSGRQEM